MRLFRLKILRRAALLFAMAPLSAACAADDGALEQAEFSPDCAASDLSCAASGFRAPLAMGTDTRVDARLRLTGSSAPPMKFTSADDTVFSVTENRVVAKQPGVAALVVSTEDDLIIDFIHLWVAAPTHLELHRLTNEGAELGALAPKVQMLVDESIHVSVAPYDSAQRLSGHIDAEWSVVGDAVTVLNEGVPGRRRLAARQAGSADVTVKALDRDVVLTIEVQP